LIGVTSLLFFSFVEVSDGKFEKKIYSQKLSSLSMLWTINDQKKLTALHDLHGRMLEYHNNIHVKEGRIDGICRESINSPSRSVAGEDEVMKSELVIAYALKLLPTLSGDAGDLRVRPLVFGELADFCYSVRSGERSSSTEQSVKLNGSVQPFGGGQQVQSPDVNLQQHSQPINTAGSGFTWIHLKDLIGMDTLAQAFDIHELIVQGFSDLRTHSSILPCQGESLITLLACNSEDNDFNMYKLYIYITEKLVITFQAEILPDMKDMCLSSADKLVQPIFDNHLRIRKKCIQLGPAYLVYELALQVLKMWDTSLEFISYALAYFNRIVHLDLLHRERLEVMIKMNIINAGAKMFKVCIEEANSIGGILLAALLDGGENATVTPSRGLGNSRPTLSGLLNNDINPGKIHLNGSGIRRYLVPTILCDDLHTPYFIDMADAYLFTNSCLENMVQDLIRVGQELDATIQLRSNNTAILLSLTATIFLPLTFFAGVFGMNFQEGADYTMSLLNSSYGVDIFIMLCVGKSSV
jgi:Mg2+ and Co2+ transporter CorA